MSAGLGRDELPRARRSGARGGGRDGRSKPEVHPDSGRSPRCRAVDARDAPTPRRLREGTRAGSPLGEVIPSSPHPVRDSRASPRQQVVHIAASHVGEVGSADTEPKSQAWSLTGSTPFLPTHIAPTQTVGPSGAPAPFVAGWISWAARNQELISVLPPLAYWASFRPSSVLSKVMAP